MRLYLAGPMSGHSDLNHPAFDAAARLLRKQGHIVHSPAEMDREVGIIDEASMKQTDLLAVMRKDLKTLLDCDGIALLPGWENSTGARLERIVAESTGIQVFLVHRVGIVPAMAWHHPAIFGQSQVFGQL